MRIDVLGWRYHARSESDDNLLHDAGDVETALHLWFGRYPHDTWLSPTAFPPRPALRGNSNAGRASPCGCSVSFRGRFVWGDARRAPRTATHRAGLPGATRRVAARVAHTGNVAAPRCVRASRGQSGSGSQDDGESSTNTVAATLKANERNPLITSEDVHCGHAESRVFHRREVLAATFERYHERFVRDTSINRFISTS